MGGLGLGEIPISTECLTQNSTLITTGSWNRNINNSSSGRKIAALFDFWCRIRHRRTSHNVQKKEPTSRHEFQLFGDCYVRNRLCLVESVSRAVDIVNCQAVEADIVSEGLHETRLSTI